MDFTPSQTRNRWSLPRPGKIFKDRRRVNDHVNMHGLISHSDDDLIGDENDPDGDLIGFELADMTDSDSFWL